MAVFVVPTHVGVVEAALQLDHDGCWRSGRLLRDRNIRVITFVVVVVARPKKLLQNLRTLIGGSSYDLNFFFCQKDFGGGGKISSSKMDDNDDIFL